MVGKYVVEYSTLGLEKSKIGISVSCYWHHVKKELCDNGFCG